MASARWKNLIFFLLCLVPCLSELYACPMCSDIVERGKDALSSWRFGSGIGWSILVMLGVPFSILGTLVYTIWKGQQRNARQRQESLTSGNGN